MAKKFQIFLLLLFCINISAQNEVSFSYYSFAKSKGYKVKIKESDLKILIEIKLADSISSNLHTDKGYLKLKKKVEKIASRSETPDIELIKPLVIQYEIFYEKYTYYRTENIVLDKITFSEYYKAFKEILTTPTPILLNESKNKIRIVLDGHPTTFIVKTTKHQDIFHVSSPDEESHPIITKFIKSTFEVFGKEKKNNFLDLEYTFGL